jgi:hypothetical protein
MHRRLVNEVNRPRKDGQLATARSSAARLRKNGIRDGRCRSASNLIAIGNSSTASEEGAAEDGAAEEGTVFSISTGSASKICDIFQYSRTNRLNSYARGSSVGSAKTKAIRGR